MKQIWSKEGAAEMAHWSRRRWASGKQGWAAVEFRLVCMQYRVPLELGREWIRKVRAMYDENSVLNAPETVLGLPAAPSHESFEVVAPVSGK